jgi:hypothetical protein
MTMATMKTAKSEVSTASATAVSAPVTCALPKPDPRIAQLEAKVAELTQLVASLLETALVADRRIQRLGGGQF